MYIWAIIYYLQHTQRWPNLEIQPSNTRNLQQRESGSINDGCIVFVWLQVVRDFFLSSWASSCWMLWMEILSYYVESNGNRTWVSILLMQMWYICGFLNLKRKKREKKNKESHNGQILIFILFWVLTQFDTFTNRSTLFIICKLYFYYGEMLIWPYTPLFF